MRIPSILVLAAAVICVGGCIADKDTKTPPAGAGDASKSTGAPLPKLPDGGNVTGVAMSQKELAEKSDIPLYPGAQVPEGLSSVTQQGPETRYELDMVTSDKPDKAADFFVSKMKVDKAKAGGKIDMLGDTPKGHPAHISISVRDGKTVIKAVSLVENK